MEAGGEGVKTTENKKQYIDPVGVSWGRIQIKTWFMGPYAGVDYNLTLCPLQSRLQHI